MTNTTTLDDRAVTLRSRGRSYATIARLLGYDSARDAAAAFNRGVRRRPEPERSMIREQELERLEVLAQRLRATTADGDTADLDRKLRTVERLRTMLLTD